MAISKPRAKIFHSQKAKEIAQLSPAARDLLLITSRRFGIFKPFKVKAKPEDASARSDNDPARTGQQLRLAKFSQCILLLLLRPLCTSKCQRGKKIFLHTYATILFMNCWIFHAFPSCCCCCCCCCGALGHNKSVKTLPDIAVWPFIDRWLGQLVCVIIIKYKSVSLFFALLNVRLFFVFCDFCRTN